MTEEMRTAFTREFPEDLLFEIAIQHRGYTVNKIHEIPWSDPSLTLEEIGDAIPWLGPWIPFVLALLVEPPDERDPQCRQIVVHLGDSSAVSDPEQMILDFAAKMSIPSSDS